MHTDSLDLRVVLESIRTQFSAQTRFLEAAERHLVVKGVVVIDPNGAVVDHVSEAPDPSRKRGLTLP